MSSFVIKRFCLQSREKTRKKDGDKDEVDFAINSLKIEKSLWKDLREKRTV
jgi:hypothetical protein